jgi:hypothetical protein
VNESELSAALVKASCAGGDRALRAAATATAIRNFGGYRWVGVYDVGLEQISLLGWDGPAEPAAIGALEEPASGTTAAALALYLAAHGQLDEPNLVIEQGVEMGRPSRIDVTVDAPDTATVRGGARKLLSGPLELWSSDGS